MSRLDRAHRSVDDLAEAIRDNDGNELESLLLDHSDMLVSAILRADDYFDRNYNIDQLIDLLSKRRAAQLWAEQPHIYVANAREIAEMDAA